MKKFKKQANFFNLEWGDCMDTQKIASEYWLAQWAKVIQARQDSGKNIKDFCLAEGINRNAYFYWQRRLRKAACTEIAIKEKSIDIMPNGWMQLAPAQQTKATLGIEINGCHVEVNTDTDPELLKKVCLMLRSL